MCSKSAILTARPWSLYPQRGRAPAVGRTPEPYFYHHRVRASCRSTTSTSRSRFSVRRRACSSRAASSS
eukprot:12703-Prymnesium_polylepis.1